MAPDTHVPHDTAAPTALPPETAGAHPAALSPGPLHGGAAESLDPLLELELSLGLSGIGEAEFAAHVRSAARAAGGEMLFDLPGSGLMAGCRRVAALRIPQPEGPAILFACLAADGETVRLVERTAETEPLARFAEAFVSVVERLKP